MESEKCLSPINVIAAVLIAVLVISASVTAVLFDRGAYARLQDRLGLPEAAGVSEDVLLENYNALIDYNSVFFAGPLRFPSFDMSDAGRTHFGEVKRIFSAFQIALIVSAALSAACCIVLLPRRRRRFLALGGILAVAIPAFVLGVMAAVGWDRFFVLFHKILFDNDFWVFDASTDPVILILPDEFFLGCLVRISLGIAIPSALLIAGPALLERFRTGLPSQAPR